LLVEDDEGPINSHQYIVIIHGWFLWIAWGLLGMVQIFSTRYLKKYWRVNILVHTVVGTLILVMNTLFCIAGFRKMKFTFELEVHNVLGIICMISTAMVVAGGYYSRYLG
jgi:L-asparagine transporter-like permease